MDDRYSDSETSLCLTRIYFTPDILWLSVDAQLLDFASSGDFAIIVCCHLLAIDTQQDIKQIRGG